MYACNGDGMSAVQADQFADVVFSADPVDMSALMQILSQLDDADIAAFEDDLDLFHFSGVIESAIFCHKDYVNEFGVCLIMGGFQSGS